MSTVFTCPWCGSAKVGYRAKISAYQCLSCWQSGPRSAFIPTYDETGRREVDPIPGGRRVRPLIEDDE